MKKITFSVVTILLFSQLHSQITQNNWLAGGNGTFSTGKTKFSTGENTSTQINISPKVGYFIIDRFASGLFGSYSRSLNKSNNIKSIYTYYGIGPFVRYYFLSLENRTNFLLEGNIAYNEQGNNSVSTNSGFLSYGASIGPAIFLNTSVALEFLIGYKGFSETKTDTKSNGINFSIGIQYHLEREK